MATQRKRRAVGENLILEVYRIDYTELVAADTAETVDLVTLPDNATMVSAFIDNVTAFTDSGSISACAIEVGSSGDADSFVTSYDLFGSTGRVEVRGAWESADGLTVRATFTATGANFGDGATADLDSGEVDVYIAYRVLE